MWVLESRVFNLINKILNRIGVMNIQYSHLAKEKLVLKFKMRLMVIFISQINKEIVKTRKKIIN